MATANVLILIVVGSVLFHIYDDVHFAHRIAALDAGLVCALSALAVAKQACDHSAVAAG